MLISPEWKILELKLKPPPFILFAMLVDSQTRDMVYIHASSRIAVTEGKGLGARRGVRSVSSMRYEVNKGDKTNPKKGARMRFVKR